jgi:hypothetical protein
VKASATWASGPAASASTSRPKSPPTKPDISEMPSASPPRPRRFISNPSITVAAAALVPGVRMRIAGMEPPYSAPT